MRSLLPVLGGLLAFGIACTGISTEPEAPPPPPKPPENPVTTIPTPTPKTYDQVLFTCCSHERISRLVEQYLDVTRTMATMDESHMDGELTALRGVAKGAIQMGNFGAEDTALLNTIVSTCETMQTLKPGQRRNELKTLSNNVITLARKYQGSGDKKVAEVYCSMADGSWLQDAATIQNPYDPKMSTCGEFK